MKLKRSAREKKLSGDGIVLAVDQKEDIYSPPSSPSARMSPSSQTVQALPLFTRPQAAIRKNPSTSTLETSLLHSASRQHSSGEKK